MSVADATAVIMLIVLMMICGDHIHDLANVIMSIITGRAIAQRLDMRNTRKAFRRKQRNPGHLLLLAKGKNVQKHEGCRQGDRQKGQEGRVTRKRLVERSAFVFGMLNVDNRRY